MSGCPPLATAGGARQFEGALLVCGTTSDAGKSRLVAGLCRLLARRGVGVAPFKAQNMSLNSTVTRAGHEIARSQASQAMAACTEPDVIMGPVLLKPSGPLTSQLVLMGKPSGEVHFGDEWEPSALLEAVVLPALRQLRARYQVVLAEGAGGAAEINLLDRDIANLPLARQASLPAVLVADIERGGVFASLFGTVELLPLQLRAQLRGFVINKFRGETGLLQPGIDELERRLGLPCFGVIPHLGHLPVDEEDSLALAGASWKTRSPNGHLLDVVIIALPHISNFTDFSPLEIEGGLALRYVRCAEALAEPDLVVLPGSKATVADLSWLRESGLASAVLAAKRRGTALLGICGGFQILGGTIEDNVESGAGEVDGLGVLPMVTRFRDEKTTRWREGKATSGEPVTGYEIHQGQVFPTTGTKEWFWLEGPSGPEAEGVADILAGVWGTSLHGLFENDELRSSFLSEVARRRNKAFRPSGLRFAAARERMFDLLATTCERHLDLERLFRVIAEAGDKRRQ